jgi:hypothetical protein
MHERPGGPAAERMARPFVRTESIAGAYDASSALLPDQSR